MARRPRRVHIRHKRPVHHRNKKLRNNFSKRKPSRLKRMNWFTRKHPIATGVILIIASIVLLRLSFTNAFLNRVEIFMWSILVSIGLFLAGLLVLIGWWRNNISNLTTRHPVRMR